MNPEYTIIEAFDISDLTSRVNTLIGDGWTPHGSPYFANGRHYQSMTRPAQPAGRNKFFTR